MIFSLTRQLIGQQGERTAERYLLEQGLRLVTRNYRCQSGEIDLIMRDGDTLVFVEVRQRKSSDYGSPLETVSVAKQRKILSASQHYLQSEKISSRQAMRFDVVGVIHDGKQARIDWVRNAF
jgi:putative endonuclease